jgi:superfamily I DNA/RNA helicase
MIEPSERQQQIFTEWVNTNNNILINAVAGSGKTTTLIELLKRSEWRTLFLAFNKSIQEEIQNRIDAERIQQGKSMTIHSLGLLAIKQVYRKVSIVANKNIEINKKVQEKHKADMKWLKWADKLKISYCLSDMNDVSRMFLTDDYNKIKEYFASMDKSFVDNDLLEHYWASFVEIRNKTYEETNLVIDFNDMIYLPVVKNLIIPVKPYYLMIDECQDLNLCQHKMIDNFINQGDINKWIAVGDKHQSIYGFSGAYSSSFDMFKERENVVELPLDVCYRCSDVIISYANEVYDIMNTSNKPGGIVETTDNPALIKDNSMVICRNSSPLINLYFQLLALNKNCYIKGEDILNSIIRFIKPYNNLTVSSALVEMDYKLEELKEKDTDEDKLRYYLFKEDLNNFRKITAHLCVDFETIDSFLNKLKSLFVDKENAIMLCTIHKSKGLENDVVYILNEDLIPSRFAKSEEQLIQEQNLKYVARTRAKKELYFLEL